MAENGLTWRRCVLPDDVEAVAGIVDSTGFFTQQEIAVARELVTERLLRGGESGYFFLFALAGGMPAGYTCYGPIPATRCGYDLYWLAVHRDFQARGIGSLLLGRTEKLVRDGGGCRLYAETSTRSLYEPTRAFYRRQGFELEAVLEDFYAPGDGKAVFVKRLS